MKENRGKKEKEREESKEKRGLSVGRMAKVALPQHVDRAKSRSGTNAVSDNVQNKEEQMEVSQGEEKRWNAGGCRRMIENFSHRRRRAQK